MEPMVLKTGTTTVGIVCKDGVVLASDKRATAGNLIVDKKAQKIHKITDNIALTTAGSVSDIQLMIKLTRAQLNLKELRTLRPSSVKEAVGLLSGMVYNNVRRMSMIPGIAHFIVGGTDTTGTYLYDLFPDGSLTEYHEYVTSGSGSVFALGVLETLYDSSMNVEQGVDLAVKSISAALQRDNASGNGITIMTITKSGAKEYASEMIDTKITLNGNTKITKKKTKKKE